MKYLFFDIECSNCFNGFGKICEFGYVLTDENFKVVSAQDIPMSPGKGRDCRFHLRDRMKEEDIELAYDEDYYFNQLEFPSFYNRIKKLMEDPDTICFAYSMGNDIRHLYNTCVRYKLEPINYECYDVQKFVAKYLEIKEQLSLHKACLQIVGPNSLVKLHEHLSRDDAEMERLIFEAICQLTKISSKDYLEQNVNTKVNSIVFMSQLLERTKRKRIKAKGHDLYNSLAVPNEELNKEEYIGKRYNMSGGLKCHFDELQNAIKIVQERNGVLCNKLTKSDYFIVYDNDDKKETLKNFSRPFKGKVLTYQEFIELISKGN